MNTLGAILMLVGGVAFSVAFVAAFYTVLGLWAGVAAAAFMAVVIGRYLVLYEDGGDL